MITILGKHHELNPISEKLYSTTLVRLYKRGKSQNAAMLKSKGADPNVYCHIDDLSRPYSSSLAYTLKLQSLELIYSLLAYGADFDTLDDHPEILDVTKWAAENGHEAVVELLLEKAPALSRKTKTPTGHRCRRQQGTATKRWSSYFSRKAPISSRKTETTSEHGGRRQ